MIENINEYLVGIAIGVRFRANFSIEDQLGKIVDTILYSKKSFFNSRVFSKVHNSVGNKILFNEYTQDKIHIDNSNIILDINFQDEVGFKQNDIQSILTAYQKDIIDGIVRDFKIKEIIRIGYVKRYLFTIEKLATSFVDKTIGNTSEGIDDINLRFSRKFPTEEGLVRQDVNDHDNAIFNVIKKSNLNEMFMSVDFQRYFDPFLSNAAEMKFNKFIERADYFNSNSYPEWINRNYLEAIDEK